MATTSVPAPVFVGSPDVVPRLVVRRNRSAWQILMRNRMAMLGAAVVVAWVLTALLAPLIAPYDPVDQDVRGRLLGPSASHLLGVDELGRDVLSRVLFGGRVSLPAAFVVVLLASVFGTIYGGLAGIAGKWADDASMRVVDMVLAFPSLILAMAIGAALGASIQNSMLAMLLVWWPPYARVSRGQVLSLKQRDFVTAARAVGLSDWRVLIRHILPNALSPALVLMTMDFGNAIIITAALSFLGLGAVPPTPEWGAMVAEGRELVQQWWISTFPGLAIFSVAIACNFIGDGLRDAIDPRLRVR
ncbi:MAG TPA: ABC transporter permease [Chloroflexota bacterium]|nr:ABC transporter permease [Chloroflexota bacterium]